jgi:hypothetical protein
MSSDKKLYLHANALNLARRWSVQNENDLMQVRRLLKWTVDLLVTSLMKGFVFMLDAQDLAASFHGRISLRAPVSDWPGSIFFLLSNRRT